MERFSEASTSDASATASFTTLVSRISFVLKG